jgi:phosphatidate cytidylyltransferase
MLRQRIITALILGPVLLWLLVWAPASVLPLVIAAVMLIGAWEWGQFCGLTSVVARLSYAAVVAALIWAVSEFATSPNCVLAVWVVAFVWWVAAFFWLSLAPLRVNAIGAGIAGLLVLVPTWLALTKLSAVPTSRPSYLLFVLVLIFAADIGAYFAGRAFGRIKLAPRVSPGKTWEGVIGGLVSAMVVALAGAFWFALPTAPFLLLCVAVVGLSIIGDLTESMFKRHVGLKDSSGLLPGHGGILDRIDSITAATPIFALGLTWFGVL